MGRTAVIGTNHFVSFGAALSYYGSQYGRNTVSEVRNKIEQKEIVVGEKPELQPGDKLMIDRSEGRYKIERRVSKILEQSSQQSCCTVQKYLK